MKTEFEIGDKVHFRAYKHQPEGGIPAKVVDISQGMTGTGKHMDGTPDERVFYMISGVGVVSNTTGTSLIESKLYEEPTE